MASAANRRGQIRSRRRHRAERREATADIREVRNTQMREAGHPGWVTKQRWPDWF